MATVFIGLFLLSLTAEVRVDGNEVEFSGARGKNLVDQIRQRTERQEASCDDEDLEKRLAEIQCNADYLNALERTGMNGQCSYTFTFRWARLRFTSVRRYPECATDENGTFCGVHDSRRVNPKKIAEEVFGACLSRPGKCSEECKSMLRRFAGMFGCCIHSLDVLESDHLIRVLTPRLWEDCEVARPEPCANGPSELTPLSVEPACSFTSDLYQAQALFCKHQAADAMRAYEDCGDEQTARRIAQMCGFNEDTLFCGGMGSISPILYFYNGTPSELNNDYVRSLYEKCVSFLLTGTCSTECRQELTRAKDSFGCCLNSINDTAVGSFLSGNSMRKFVTSYDLWTSCDVVTPSLCHLSNDSRINGFIGGIGCTSYRPTTNTDDIILAAVRGTAVGVLVTLVLFISGLLVVLIVALVCYRK